VAVSFVGGGGGGGGNLFLAGGGNLFLAGGGSRVAGVIWDQGAGSWRRQELVLSQPPVQLATGLQQLKNNGK